jgi:hypothetical protein
MSQWNDRQSYDLLQKSSEFITPFVAVKFLLPAGRNINADASKLDEAGAILDTMQGLLHKVYIKILTIK